MNIRGIELLRKSRYPGPRREILLSPVSRDGYIHPTALDLDWLYGGTESAAIISFDHRESIRQQQQLEKDEHAYPILRDEFEARLDELTERMLAKGVPAHEIVYMTHQAYGKGTIAIAGKVGISPVPGAQALLGIDLRRDFRLANTGEKKPADYRFICPYAHGMVDLASATELNDGLPLPEGLRSRLIAAVLPFAKDVPLIDFEVHKEWGLFYHDMSFDAAQRL